MNATPQSIERVGQAGHHARPAHPANSGHKAERPKLLLVIAVDQFRFDYLTRFRDRYTSGIAKLLNEGAVYVDAHQDHFPTVTATGHAALLTGSRPSIYGIVGNEWYDRASGKSVTSVEDAVTTVVGIPGQKVGSSPHNLVVSTLADEIKMSGLGESKTIGISMKDRAAILPGGRMANAAYWLDANSGAIITSTYYRKALPDWATKFNNERWPAKSLGAKWDRRAGDDRQPRTFMTLPSEPNREFMSKWEETPFANQMLEALSERALVAEDLGKHPSVDVLTVSFSANDHLGHAVGPDAPEVEDMSVATDETIGKLIYAAEKQVGGPEHLVVVLSADHGVAPVPEVNIARHMPGGRFDKKEALAKMEQSLEAKFGGGKWILASGEGTSVYLNRQLMADKNLSASEVEDEVARLALTFPFVDRAYTAENLLQHRAGGDLIDGLVASGFYPERSPDVFIIAKPYYLSGTEGTSHGTPFAYDTHVPLIFYGYGIEPGTYSERVGVSDIAPTLAALLQVQTPSGSIGHVLSGVFSHPNVNVSFLDTRKARTVATGQAAITDSHNERVGGSLASIIAKE